MARIGAAGLGAVIVWAAPAVGQSVTSIQGPGYPILPVDARTAVLGGVGVGVHGMPLSLTNPAALGRAVRRGGSVTLETVERSVELGGATDRIGTTRFPLLRLVFPAGGLVYSAGYGGYLDQSWGLVRDGQQLLEGATVDFRDVMTSEGGVGQFLVGAALPIGEQLSVGASFGALTGSQRVNFRRGFDTTSIGRLDPYQETLNWRYSGPTAQLGMAWDPAAILRVGASVTWAGTLTGEPTEGRAASRQLQLPLQVAGGASSFLVPGLMTHLSARWSGWSVTDPLMGVPPAEGSGEPAPARDTWEVGGGMEWINPARTGRRVYPVRAGFQYRQLPFPFGDTPPNEWFAGAGVGMRIGTDAGSPLGSADLSVQRGQRTAAGNGAGADLTEAMWRVVLSLSLFGT